MLPIRLTTQRFADGYEIQDEALVARTTAREPLVIDSVDLENPLSIRFLNCKLPEEYAAFYNRFGDLPLVEFAECARTANLIGSVIRLGLFKGKLNYFTTAPGDGGGPLIEPTPLVTLKESVMNWGLGAVSLAPELQFHDGEPRLALRATRLIDFMWLEIAVAVEVGAASGGCTHCGKLFLTGPLTGRRSHAKYCSDRCRVAAMRVRNSRKEA